MEIRANPLVVKGETLLQTSQALEYFISAKRAEGRSEQTLIGYERAIDRFLKWAEDPDITAITIGMVRAYITYLQNSDMRRVSVASYIRPLKVFTRFLHAEELITIEPFKRVKVPTFDRKLHDLISDEDFRKLLAACNLQEHEGRRNAAIISVLYDTGVRVGELVNIKHSDIEPKARYARVFGKGSKERVVFYSAHTAVAITRYTSRMPARYRSDYLFTSLRRNVGGRMSVNGVDQMLARLAARAQVTSRVNPHTFRHTFATNYLRAGGDLNSLMRLMGHSDLTILQTYLSLATDDLRAKHEQYSPMARVMGRR